MTAAVEDAVWLWAAPAAGGHWKVHRGTTWVGWVHRLDRYGRRWRAKPPTGEPLPAVFRRRRDAIAALTGAPA